MAALISGLVASVVLGEALGQWLSARWAWAPRLSVVGGHALAFLLPYLGFQATGMVLCRLGRTLFLGGLDRVAGALLGIATGIVLSGAGLSVLAQSGRAAAWLSESTLAAPLSAVFLQASRWAADVAR